MKAIPRSRFVLFAVLAAGGCAVDLVTKHWIFDRLGMPGMKPTEWLVTNVFGFTTSLNQGALFGIGQGRGALFASLSVVALLGILYWLFVSGAAHDLLLTVALGAVCAGIFGNLYDRLGLPGLKDPTGQAVLAVRDWLDFRLINWPIFNIADSLLVCGAGLLVWHAFSAERHGRSSLATEPVAPSPVSEPASPNSLGPKRSG
ncbi:MAG TPA: signal peptidase II [Pirellulales bacterium]|jgi:signal peptidase II|nr:signal peptidase II [Pirellulales bacterium]